MSLEQAILKECSRFRRRNRWKFHDHARRLRAETGKKPPFKSVDGLWAGLGISLSAEEIDENQRKMWKNLPPGKTSDGRCGG